MGKYITVGMPLYKGQDLVAEALQALQVQTYKDFEVIISVDGGDELSADACRPFLADSRFRMHVHSKRLDWVGNFNWLLQQPMGDFFCYRQHDDTTSPEFFEKLVALAGQRPDAAIVYADCQFVGESSHIETTASIEGDQLTRLRQFVQHIRPTACRGIARKEAIAQAGQVRVDEFRSNHQIFVWLLKMLRWGSFLRLPEPIYYRRLHASNYHKENKKWPYEKKLADWTTIFTGFLEAVTPVCSSVEERFFFQNLILDRVSVRRPDQTYNLIPSTAQESGTFALACFERLRLEGLTDLWLLPPHLQADAERLMRKLAEAKREQRDIVRANRALLRENNALKKSRALRLSRALRGFLGQ
jgi:glycosyltransferase involved in cell wall biosynthesis